MTLGQGTETDEEKKKSLQQERKRWHLLFEAMTSPITIGVLVTLLFVVAAFNYYQVRGNNDTDKKQNALTALFDVVEWADLKSMDMRFRWRGEKEPTAPVALLTIDDRSVEEIGRWPWSREKTAHVLETMFNYGAKAIAMDIVFAEPQIDNTLIALDRIEKKSGKLPSQLKPLFDEERKKANPDEVLAKTIEKYKSKIVLGSFSDGDQNQDFRPYQDYCRSSALKYNIANHHIDKDKFINSQNSTFLLDDNADYFVTIHFDQLLPQIFQIISESRTEQFLKMIAHKTSATELNHQELSKLRYTIEASITDYCERWLTEKDEFLADQTVTDAYLTLFQNVEELKGLDFQSAILKFKKLTKSHPIPQRSGWTINSQALQSSSEFTGSFNAEQDNDGSIRRAALFFRTGNKVGTSFLPSIGLQSFLLATGYQARIGIDLDPSNPEQKKLVKFDIFDTTKDPEILFSSVPVDGQGRLTINYAGGTNSYPYVSAKELFTDSTTMLITRKTYDAEHRVREIKSIEVDKAKFIKDKVFVFGATAVGIFDLRVTPFEKNYPGAETHVNVIGNLFDRNFLSSPSNESNWMLAILFVLGIILTIIYNRVGANLGLIITLVALATIIGLDQYLFSKGFFTTMVLPFFMILNVYMIMTFYKYFTEERKKKHLRATFSKYVSPAIVDEILKSPEGIELGGKKQRMTVFFSDVRGFTTISESLDPAKLSSVLNRYLTPMTQIVFQNKGTLDKYMGDAVMAFFGAPVFFENHAEFACRCALQSIAKLRELQAEFEKEGLPRIDIGIGINSSEMSVGNMGSDIVRSYTVMGDAVNLGSRLEGITKEYGIRIIISEFTYNDVREKFTCREIDWVRVKGKNKPVKIYELICEGPAPVDWKENIHHFNHGFDFYHQLKFEKALECFQLAAKTRGGDTVSSLYIERCQDYIAHPPAEDWDGVYNLKTK